MFKNRHLGNQLEHLISLQKTQGLTTMEKILLKDQLFNRMKVEKIAREIMDVYPKFEKSMFVKDVITGFLDRELKARISWIAECLRNFLPADFKKAVSILNEALPPPNNPNLSDNDFGDFIYAPYTDFIAKYGCTRECIDISLSAIYQMTKRFSAEDSIRYFINAYPKETLVYLKRLFAQGCGKANF